MFKEAKTRTSINHLPKQSGCFLLDRESHRRLLKPSTSPVGRTDCSSGGTNWLSAADSTFYARDAC